LSLFWSLVDQFTSGNPVVLVSLAEGDAIQEEAMTSVKATSIAISAVHVHRAVTAFAAYVEPN
jgi:hypothetical protein